MRSQNSQKGYALLLLLTGLSAATLGIGLLGSNASSNQWKILTQDAFQLSNERNRLIHYAVDYVNLYASGGAGPGHLPCPDTDLGSDRPGPNPPCAGNTLATGKLPDGVTRQVGRIALTDSLLNRSTYTVSRSLVNNPSLAIHALAWPEEYDFNSHGMGYVKLSRPSGQTRTITQHQLHKPTLNWVRAWLTWQLLESSLAHCRKYSPMQSSDHVLVEFDSSQRLPTRVTDEITDEITDQIADVLTEDMLVGFCPEVSDIEVHPMLVDPQTLALCDITLPLCVFDSESALAWLVEPDAEHWQDSQVDNHWFVENHWLNLFQLQTYPSCINRSEDCVLSVDVTNDRLMFRLSPDVQILDEV